MSGSLLRVIVLLILGASTLTYAQTGGTTAPASTAKTGKISGKVVDVSTGEALLSATVQLEGTKLGAFTNLDGDYIIHNVPPGLYVLNITAIGYTAKRVTELEVKSGEMAVLDISMSSQIIETGKEVVVTAKRERSSEPAAIKDRGQSKVTKDILTSNSIAKTPDGTADAALNRSVGGQSKDGEAIIRGVGDRGTVVTMNGSIMPSSDPTRQTAKIDQVSTSVIESIEIIKTFSPELPGHFSGGLVNIKTKSAPTAQSLSVSYGNGYHSETTNKSNFLTQQAGNRTVPAEWDSPFAKATFQKNVRSTKSRDTLSMLQSLNRSFFGHAQQSTRKADPNQSYSLSYGNGADVLGGRFGVNLSLSRSQDYKTTTDGVQAIWLVPSTRSTSANPNKLYNEQRSEESDIVNGLLNLSFAASDRHNFSAAYVRTEVEETTTRFLQGGAPSALGLGPDDTLTQQIRTVSSQFDDRTLESFQFLGSHKLGSDSTGSIRVDWSASFTSSKFDTPDLRVFQDIVEYADGNGNVYTTPIYRYNPSVVGGAPSRVFRKVDEDINSFTANMTFLFGKQTSMKLGLAGDNKRRGQTERFFTYAANGNLTAGAGPYAYLGSLDTYYGALEQVLYTVNSTTGDTTFELLNVIQEQDRVSATYYGTQDVYAVYGMFDTKLTSKFSAVYGVRFEQTLMFGKNGHPQQSTSHVATTLNSLDVLPAVNLKYALLSDVNLRLSYGKTLARPTIREYVDIFSEDFGNSGRIFNGNPDLEISTIDNYDFRVEWLYGQNVLAASAFYKSYTNPIELVFLDGDNGNYRYQNVPEGTVYGVELEFRRGLGFLADVLQPFDINSNLTLVESETKISEAEKIQRGITLTEDTRPMYNQAPYTVNVGLGYTNTKLGTAVNFSMHRIADRLSFNPAGITPDVYLESRTIMDVTLKQDIWNGFSVKVSGKNLTDSRDIEQLEFNGTFYVFSRSGAGRSVSVGLNWLL